MSSITIFIVAIIRILKIHMSLIFSMYYLTLETAYTIVSIRLQEGVLCCDFEFLQYTISGIRAPQSESRGRDGPFRFRFSVRFEHWRQSIQS